MGLWRSSAGASLPPNSSDHGVSFFQWEASQGSVMISLTPQAILASDFCGQVGLALECASVRNLRIQLINEVLRMRSAAPVPLAG